MKDETYRSRIEPHPLSNTSPQYGFYSLVFLVYLSCSLFLVILAWRLLNQPIYFPPLSKYPNVSAVFLALSMAIQRAISFSPWQLVTARGYRLAFLMSASLGGILWIYQVLTSSSTWQIGVLGSALLGAFAGALLVTFLNEGLWEINFPPARQLNDLVRRRHRELLGEPLSEPWAKRFFDLALALFTLIVFAPVFLVVTFLIWWEDPGPLFFIKNSVGKGGKSFQQIKFRTMIRNAEKETGPILARKNDSRLLRLGKYLRKSALDELPQIFNILRGDMSFIGPRPQRSILVCAILQEIPQYVERHKVRPGLAGLAQVLGHYYLTPLQKLRFDRLYVRNLNLWLDLKLLLSPILVVYVFRWRKGWDGHLPRGWTRNRRPRWWSLIHGIYSEINPFRPMTIGPLQKSETAEFIPKRHAQ